MSNAMKPSELAMTHLREVVQMGRLPVGARLPAAVDLAAELGISQGTVKNVYRQLAREGKVRTRTGDGSFWIGGPQEAPAIYRLGIDRDPDSAPVSVSSWHSRIWGGLMHAKLACNLPVQVSGLEIDFGPDGKPLTTPPELEQLDGVLLIRLRTHAPDSIRLGGREIPCVSLNPHFENASRNFVSPDYFASASRVGTVWRQSGRRRILSVLSPGMERSVSVRLRYGGLLCGLELGSCPEMESRYVSAPTASEEHGYNAVREFLATQPWRPDAVYTAGDLLAFGAIRALEEAGLRVPEDVSVVGGSGHAFMDRPPRFLTCTQHQLEALGGAMFDLLIQRIEQRGADVPAAVVPCRIVAGTTTRPQENELFAAATVAASGGASQRRARPPRRRRERRLR